MPVSVSTTRTVSRRSTRTRSCATRHAEMLPPDAAAARRDRAPTGRWPRPSLVDAETIEDALVWLKPKERMVVHEGPGDAGASGPAQADGRRHGERRGEES